MVSRCYKIKELDVEFTLISNMAVISIIEYCQNIVKLRLPEPDPDEELNFLISHALNTLPKLEYLWIKLDRNINIEAENLLLALLPNLCINSLRIRAPIKEFQIASPRQTLFPDEGIWDVPCKRIDLFEFTTFYRDLLSIVKPFYNIE